MRRSTGAFFFFFVDAGFVGGMKSKSDLGWGTSSACAAGFFDCLVPLGLAEAALGADFLRVLEGSAGFGAGSSGSGGSSVSAALG